MPKVDTITITFYAYDIISYMSELDKFIPGIERYHTQGFERFRIDVEPIFIHLDTFAVFSEAITDTDLDLSFASPMNRNSAVDVIERLAMYTNGEVSHIPPYEKPGIIRSVEQIVVSCRSIALHSLMDIGTIYGTAGFTASSLGELSVNSDDVVRQLLNQDLYIEPNQQFTDRALAELALSELRIRTNELWQPLFTQRTHRSLAKQFLTGEIAESDLQEAFIQMPHPRFTGSAPRT